MAEPKTPLLSLEALHTRGLMLHGDVLTAFRLASAATNEPLLRALNYLVLANQALLDATRADPEAKKESSGG